MSLKHYNQVPKDWIERERKKFSSFNTEDSSEVQSFQPTFSSKFKKSYQRQSSLKAKGKGHH